MTDPQVQKHYIVAKWTTGDEENPLGFVDSPYDVLYDDVEDAKDKAKELAAAAPGSVWVVYLGLWYSYTDETPVNIKRIVGVSGT